MKITQITKTIHLDRDTHKYTFEGMEENIPQVSVTTLIRGSSSTGFTSTEMENGTRTHDDIACHIISSIKEFDSLFPLNHYPSIPNFEEYLKDNNCPEHIKPYIEHITKCIDSYKDDDDGGRFEYYVECSHGCVIEVKGLKIYIFGTPDLVVETKDKGFSLIEIKTGKKYDWHTKQVQLYNKLFFEDKLECDLIYIDDAVCVKSKITDDEIVKLLVNYFTKQNQNHEEEKMIRDEQLIQAYMEYRSAKEIAENKRKEFEELVVNLPKKACVIGKLGFLHYSKTCYLKKTIDAEIVAAECTHAISYKEIEKTNLKFEEAI